eukprot:CAMPEP_0183803868 /NCGR_PEP_ID=MMETSP0803_2-20130417/33968_1 /TAXON_ID=195967 /ORGANISM="Crustomastix stigmata, Strain CCMP3273" /LENGTH=380 /DNA_ID=CAMNT_0026048611 /DNA_START=173 /DNA_END=1312 /DNA_ORIENTATION=+
MLIMTRFKAWARILRTIVAVYFNFEIIFLPNKIVPLLRTEGCAFLQAMEYRRSLTYFVCHKKVPFYSTLKNDEVEFVSKCGVKVPKTLGVCDRKEMDNEDFQFPSGDFVLKPTDGYKSMNVFLKRGEHEMLRKIPFTRESIVNRIKNGRYDRDIFHRYIMEELLVSEDGKQCPPYSYKFFVFKDEIVKIFFVGGYNPETKQTPILCIDSSHRKLQNLWMKKSQHFDFDAELPTKPLCWEETLESVRKVGRKVELFVRIDMYATSRGAVFGEFGFEFDPDDWTPQCSKDLMDFYNTLPQSEKEDVMANPFTPCMSADAKCGSKLYLVPRPIWLLVKPATLLLFAILSIIALASNITVSLRWMLKICAAYGLTSYTLFFILD